MLKQEQIKVEDSNMAGVGGEEDKAVRKKAAMAEPAWKGAGTKVGLEIWRVENEKAKDGKKANFGVKRWPEEKYGHFFDGDSYICMNTYKEDKKFLYDIFFWIGQDSTQDEYGTAAFKTVELDDYMGGDPVQHREVQGGESPAFLALFKNGMMIMKGGVESGFNPVKPREYQPRLLQVQKVGGTIKSFEVTCEFASLNTDDSFILDAGSKIHVWHGETASPFEKMKATSQGEEIESERGTGAERVDADEEFWSILGGTEDKVGTVSASGGADDKAVVLEKCPPKLYSLEGSDGWKLQKEGTLKKSDILDDDVMCIFTGTALYVTVGDKAPSDERRSCMIEADNFLMAHRPRGHARSTIPVTRIQVPGGRGATEDGGYLACFGETVDHHGWLSKRVGVRPLFKRHFAELVGKVLTLYTDDSKSKEDTVINLEDCESAQRSVAPRSGAEELELVCKERTYRMKCDDAEELTHWLGLFNEALGL